MPTDLASPSLWAAGVAARLRLLGVDRAEAPPDQRREFWCELVTQALRDVPAAEKPAYLTALADRFPTWNTPSAPPPPQKPPEESAEQLLSRFWEKLPQLSNEARRELVRKLEEAGVVQPKREAPSTGLTAELQLALGLDKPPALDRVLRLLCLLVDVVLKLDQVACKAIENLPFQTPPVATGTGHLREAVQQFLSATGEDQAGQALLARLEKHRRAMVALLASHVGMRDVPSLGRNYAKWFMDSFSPENLEDVVRAEGAGAWGLAQRCWKKYAERFRNDLGTREHVERRVKEATASIAERIFLMKA